MDSGLPLSGWRRRSKSPHCRVSSSAVRLDVQGQKLPWSTSKMIPIPTPCKSVVRPVLHVPACSKGVIGIFSLKAAAMSEPPKKPSDDVPREGYHKEQSKKKSCCHRPGCYARFDPHPRAPHQKYCGPECYKAMRRVLIREKKWRERLKHGKKKPSPKPSSDAHQERPA